MTTQTLVVVVVGGVGSKGGGGLETGEGESEIVITSWLLVPLLEVTTLCLRGGGGGSAPILTLQHLKLQSLGCGIVHRAASAYEDLLLL